MVRHRAYLDRMARARRPLAVPPGSIVHVTNRGNAQGDIFLNDGDRTLFLELVSAQVVRRGWSALAYCLMTNHYHLLVEVPGDDLSTGMHAIGTGYAKMFNRVYGRVGHVFQDRFGAVVAEREAHAIELARYIALNPVRARLTARPEDWPWSSWSALVHRRRALPGLGCDRMLELFGPDRRRALHALRDFIGAGEGHTSATDVHPRTAGAWHRG